MEEAYRLLHRFVDRTGVLSGTPGTRYLWTDAFAVCTFIGLARATGDRRYVERGLRLIDGVHQVLGKHRLGDDRQGWLSGLSEQAGAAHPTVGGLRIGKPLAEQRPGEPFDPELEWERDGQYFHYLTKWMHALDQTSRFTGESRFNLWARELAKVACRAFSQQLSGGGRRLVWKMSIDLRRPLVPSMGQHDPLDGFLTCDELRTTASALGSAAGGPQLQEELDGLAEMVASGDLVTDDPLGIGGLLMDAGRGLQLANRGGRTDEALVSRVLAAALEGLTRYARHSDLRQPGGRRLAFRELGLAIGLRAVESMPSELARVAGRSPRPELVALVEALSRYVPLTEKIVPFWLDPHQRRAATWLEHLDINEVMLAASLVPDGVLVL